MEIFLLWGLFIGDGWRLQSSLPEAALKPHFIAVGSLGIFVYDDRNKELHHFDHDGQVLGSVILNGSSGLNGIDTWEDKLFISNAGAVYEITPRGDLVHTYLLEKGAKQTRCFNGWLAQKAPLGSDTRTRLLWQSLDFAQYVVLGEHTRHKAGTRRENGVEYKSARPLFEDFAWTLDVERRHLFLAEPGAFHIKVIDLATGKKVDRMKKKVTKTPFDKQWGRDLIEQKNTSFSAQVKYTPDFPRFFPIIDRLHLDGAQRLWARGGDPRKPQYWCFDSRRVELAEQGPWSSTLIGAHGRHIYFLTLDPSSGERRLVRTTRSSRSLP